MNTIEKKSTFEAVPSTEEVIEIPDRVVKDMSTDAALSYRLLCAELAAMKCGTINNARWLTTGQSLIMLWMSTHGLTG